VSWRETFPPALCRKKRCARRTVPVATPRYPLRVKSMTVVHGVQYSNMFFFASQDWYCEEDAAPRQDFRRRRAEELLQSRRHTATQLLAYVPTPFLFRELPRPIPPPVPKAVSERMRSGVGFLFTSGVGGQHAGRRTSPTAENTARLVDSHETVLLVPVRSPSKSV